MAEICIKVGDSGGYRDGDVIAVRPDGWLIPAADMAVWLAGGKEPAVLAAMPKYMADGQRRRIAAVRWKTAHTAAEVEVEYKLPKGAGEMEKADADRDAVLLSTVDADTNWGTLDLQHHAVIRVTDVTFHEERELLDRDWKNDHTNATLGKVRYRVPYDSVLSASVVADMRDKDKRVDVDRASAPLVKSVIQAASRAEVEPVEKP